MRDTEEILKRERITKVKELSILNIKYYQGFITLPNTGRSIVTWTNNKNGVQEVQFSAINDELPTFGDIMFVKDIFFEESDKSYITLSEHDLDFDNTVTIKSTPLESIRKEIKDYFKKQLDKLEMCRENVSAVDNILKYNCELCNKL